MSDDYGDLSGAETVASRGESIRSGEREALRHFDGTYTTIPTVPHCLKCGRGIQRVVLQGVEFVLDYRTKKFHECAYVRPRRPMGHAAR